MAVRVKLNDNSKVVLKAMEGNVAAALNTMGIKAQNLILWQMRQGYGKPIRQTGNLQRDVQYEVDERAKVVRVGNTLEYAPHVHEGTHKMAGRPYIQDGLTGESHGKQLQQVAEEALKNGF
jgi:lipopolysaccharide export system protein LptA